MRDCWLSRWRLFLFVPELDLAASRLFYDPGRGFVLADWPPVVFLYRAIPWITWGIFDVAAGPLSGCSSCGRPLWRFDRKALIFLVVSTALGPGLLANTLLKDHWGRARPTQIEAFGGSRRIHAGAVARQPMRDQLRFCLGSRRAWLFARRLRLSAAAGACGAPGPRCRSWLALSSGSGGSPRAPTSCRTSSSRACSSMARRLCFIGGLSSATASRRRCSANSIAGSAAAPRRYCRMAIELSEKRRFA